MFGMLQRAHPTLRCHFAPAYLVGSNMLWAYLFFIYGINPLEIYAHFKTNVDVRKVR